MRLLLYMQDFLIVTCNYLLQNYYWMQFSYIFLNVAEMFEPVFSCLIYLNYLSSIIIIIFHFILFFHYRIPCGSHPFFFVLCNMTYICFLSWTKKWIIKKWALKCVLVFPARIDPECVHHHGLRWSYRIFTNFSPENVKIKWCSADLYPLGGSVAQFLQ